jgi:hypothetical protein
MPDPVNPRASVVLLCTLAQRALKDGVAATR